MSERCRLCGGACLNADLAPLLDQRLGWLWEQLAAIADRKGDEDLSTGSVSVIAPEKSEERAAVLGLLGARTLYARQERKIDLSKLTARVRARGPHLTPGALAAHYVERPLGVRRRAREERQTAEEGLRATFERLVPDLPDSIRTAFEREELWSLLRRRGWVARVLGENTPEEVFRLVFRVISGLPTSGSRLDRRRLAASTTGDPHALDDRRNLPGFVFSALSAAGVLESGLKYREAWDMLGVDSDDVTGGLISVGVHPSGWTIPPGAVVTLSPRVLDNVEWDRPGDGPGWVFVTENPSVAAAAADLSTPVRLLCTSGTPSVRGLRAIRRLSEAGWRIAARADFDRRGLQHVEAILHAVPGARPWRMGVEDYLRSLAANENQVIEVGDAFELTSSWEPRLAKTMRERKTAAFEESLLPQLISDLLHGEP